VLAPVIVSAGGGVAVGSTVDGAVAAGGAGAYVVWRCAVGLLGSGAGGAEVEMAKRYVRSRIAVLFKAFVFYVSGLVFDHVTVTNRPSRGVAYES
jgi:hypothetical protein